MGRYFDEMNKTMQWLAAQPDTLFLGQAVASPGTFLHATLDEVDRSKLLEMPVSESFQMQTTLGLALAGTFPISIFPRQNFLMLTVGDMCNMVDKIHDLTAGKVDPPLIIRTAAGTTKPIHPGHQHVGNYADAFRQLFHHIEVCELHEPEDILPTYQRAYREKKPKLIIEFGDHYGDK
jgi:pyruvate/2-oxoglutarate/acetoin dehydrogenase E1 component